jgi:hypothetical protein
MGLGCGPCKVKKNFLQCKPVVSSGLSVVEIEQSLGVGEKERRRINRRERHHGNENLRIIFVEDFCVWLLTTELSERK